MGEQRAGAGPHSASTTHGFDPLRGAQDLAVVGRSFIASYARIVEISLESSLNSCKQKVHTATVSLGSRHHRVPERNCSGPAQQLARCEEQNRSKILRTTQGWDLRLNTFVAEES